MLPETSGQYGPKGPRKNNLNQAREKNQKQKSPSSTPHRDTLLALEKGNRLQPSHSQPERRSPYAPSHDLHDHPMTLAPLPLSLPTAIDIHWYIFVFFAPVFDRLPSPTPTGGREVLGLALSLGQLIQEMETTGRPKFLGNPVVPTPCSQTPARPTCQAIRQLGTARRASNGESSPRFGNFGAQSHGISTRCLRFAVRLTPTHARLASGCWPALPDGIGYP